MEQILMDYLANATWQIPLLAGAAWLFIRLAKFGPQTSIASGSPSSVSAWGYRSAEFERTFLP
jgi:hypothetical protein